MNRFLDAIGLACLLALVLLIIALSNPSQGEPFGAPGRMSLDGPVDHCFAVVVIENRVGVYHRDEVLETEHGAVLVHYATVGGYKPGDDDQIDVVSLPDGVMADPMHIDLPDGDTGRICLMEWVGG